MIHDALVERLPRWLHGQLFDVEYWQYLAIVIVLLSALVATRLWRFWRWWLLGCAPSHAGRFVRVSL